MRPGHGGTGQRRDVRPRGLAERHPTRAGLRVAERDGVGSDGAGLTMLGGNQVEPNSLASGETASGIHSRFRAQAAPSLSASAVVVARRPAAHRSRSDLR